MQLEVYNSEELRTTEFPDLTELKVIITKARDKKRFWREDTFDLGCAQFKMPVEQPN